MEAFSKQVHSGRWGVCITRLHPQYIEQKFGLRGVKCFWLSSLRGPEVLSPQALDHIVRTVRTELAGRSSGLVYLDGLEYLLLYNSANKVVAMLREIEGALENEEAEMVISIDPLTFEPRDLAQLWAAYPHCDPDDSADLATPRSRQSGAAAPSSVSQTI
jgi:hypothetical protein